MSVLIFIGLSLNFEFIVLTWIIYKFRSYCLSLLKRKLIIFGNVPMFV